MGSAVSGARLSTVLVAWVCVGLVPVSVWAAEAEPILVGRPAQAPVALPPPDSPTLLAFPSLELSFPTQGGVSSVAGETYLYYMQIDEMISLPSQERWTPFDETIERVLLEDFRSLWDTGFLNDLTIEIIDAPYPNGVPAKRVVFLMEERERVRITTFEGPTSTTRPRSMTRWSRPASSCVRTAGSDQVSWGRPRACFGRCTPRKVTSLPRSVTRSPQWPVVRRSCS